MFEVTTVDITVAGLRYFGGVRITIIPEGHYPAPFELTFPFCDVSGLDEGLLHGLREFATFAGDLHASAQDVLASYERRKHEA